jgi:dipeptidyl aminopeptidase/acylaminoacyl peptidase
MPENIKLNREQLEFAAFARGTRRELQRKITWLAAFSVLLILASTPARAQQVREPLPLNVAVSTHGHDTRSSFEFSPDGQWIAYTWSLDETVPESLGFTATGDPMAEGNDRKQVGVTNTQTGENVAIGDPKAYNWAPVWSPDGKRIAFYSDSGGEAGVWIWDKSTGKTERFPGVIARSFFGFEIMRWSSDSQRILCKIVPEGMTLQQANALTPKNMAGRQFPAVGPDQASVIVQKAGAKEAEAAKADPNKPKESEWTNRAMADLAILDLRDHSVKRIVKRAKISWFEFSPDEKYAGYTALGGWETNTQQGMFNIFIQPVGGGDSRKLAENVRLGYGIELNWSPDSNRIAYVSCGQMGTGEVVLLSIPDGATKSLASKDIPSLNDGEGEWPPLWDSTGQNIYGKNADNNVWRIDVASGKGTLVAEIPQYKIMGIVTRNERRALWTTDGGRTIWVVAREREGSKAGIFSIDLASGQSHAVQVDERSYSNIFNLDGNDSTGSVAYVAKDQQHLADVWILDTKSGKTHQASHINQAMEHYELGTARIIDWYGMDGQKLHGALLLPPGYQKGKRLPLVVWVYGGMNGSNYVNNFGFWGDYPQFNMHVFATRGYAVLAPDAPLGEGTPMVDLVKTVIPGVDAAVELGYADPDRVAVMGQSYGSYCTLALIAQTKRFKAAVITADVLHPDVVADYLHVIGGTGYFEQGQGNMHGTPWDHRERYLENSPVYLFDQIQTPLLIGQGSADGDLIPSDATFSALQRLGKEVEYRIYENEGHVLTGKPNVLDFWNRRLDFLAEHLNFEVDANGGVVFEGDRPKPRSK